VDPPSEQGVRTCQALDTDEVHPLILHKAFFKKKRVLISVGLIPLFGGLEGEVPVLMPENQIGLGLTFGTGA